LSYFRIPFTQGQHTAAHHDRSGERFGSLAQKLFTVRDVVKLGRFGSSVILLVVTDFGVGNA
jgi:hypothetical protein